MLSPISTRIALLLLAFAPAMLSFPCRAAGTVSDNDALTRLADMPQSQDESLTQADLDRIRQSFIDATIVSHSPSAEVTERFLTYSEYGRAAIDVLLMQLYLSIQLPEEEVDRVMGLFDREKRQWRDIDYTDMSRGGWDMTLHITRIYALAKSYASPQSPFHKDPGLSDLLHRAIGWWCDNRPENPNWWHNEIGVPKKLGAAVILLLDELSESEIQGVMRVLDRSKFGRTGQNKAWLAGNQLMKALIIGDPLLALEAKRQIAEEIYITDSEGIQKDWSFHQHGPMMQFGNYGLAYAEGISFWIRALQGTALAFSEEQVGIMEGFIFNGLSWTVWNGFMDPQACGRQLHIDGGRGKAYSLAVTASNMAALGRPLSEQLRHIALQNLQPEKYENGLTGAKYYFRSDYGIYRTADWYASIRMHSTRTIGFEFTNAENLLANFSADGALLLMQSGREYENIFPYWDWRMLPGTTVYYDGKPIKCDDSPAAKRNCSAHVGGMTRGDGMVTTMELERDGLHAFKSNFFFGDMVVCLGSDIRTSRAEIDRVTTSVEQNHLVGKPVSGTVKVSAASSAAAVAGAEKTGWVSHNERGYVSLDGAELHIDTAEQKGSWANMAPSYTQLDSGRVFKCWFEHDAGAQSGYAYAVLPHRSARQVKSFARSYSKGRADLKVLANDAACQAVSYRGNIYAVIHKAGTYDLNGVPTEFRYPVLYMLIDGKPEETRLPQANE